MRIILSLLIVIFSTCSFNLLAQIGVTGKVTDETGFGLPGVNIVIGGSSNGTVTDFDGNYALQADEEDVLVFTYIGYLDQSVTVQSTTEINVSLQPDALQMEEVVVIGYGTQKKSDVTGSTGVISTKDIDLQPIQRVEGALQGKVAGVVVSQNSGAPGSAPKVSIRGFTGNPVYVIDGFLDGDINAINPNDIESISVLKDASATAIYGSRGANGVILVTTKSGKTNSALKIDAEYYHTISQLHTKLELLDAYSYMRVVNQKLDEGGALPAFTNAELNAAKSDPNFGTDWQDEIFRTAHSDNMTLNLSKGWEKTAFRLSLGGRNDNGIINNSSYKRYSGRINVNSQILPKTKLVVNAGYAYERTQNILGGNNKRNDPKSTIAAAATGWSPNLPVIDPSTGDYTGFPGYGATVLKNPVYQTDEINAIGNRNIYNTSVSLEQEILSGLKAKATYAMQYVESNGDKFTRYSPGSPTTVNTSDGEHTKQQYNFQLDYNKSFGEDHDFSVTGVAEVLDRMDTRNKYINTYSEPGVPGETIPTPLKASDPLPYEELGQLSFLGRAHYSYKDKILLTGSLRADASSRLPKDNQWDQFYSGAIAYRMGEEEFIQNVSFIEDLKLRVGYGEVGNVNSIKAFQIQNNTNPDIGGYVFDGQLVSGSEGFEDGKDRANPDLFWETSRTWNTGMDLSLWEGKIELNADYYIKWTENSHFKVPVPSYLGGGTIKTNSGRYKNSGVELTLTHQWKPTSDFSMRTSVNASFNQSEVLSFPSDSLYVGAQENGFDQLSHILIEGQQLGQLWGYRYLGSKIAGQPAYEGEIPSAQVGDAIYYDGNGNGQIDIGDMEVLGNGHPDFTWGFNSFIDYKNFSLNIFVQGIHGVDAYNLPQHGLLGGGAGILDATSTEILNSSSFGGPLPALNANFRAQSSLFVEDASFIRLKNIMLAYNFSEPLVEKISLSRLRVYAGVQNILTITNYKGYDPETKSGTDQAPGIDKGSFPVPRTFTFGLNISY